MKLYIAASIRALSHARFVAEIFTLRGHAVVSTWHVGELLAPSDGGLSLPQRKLLATKAMDEIDAADALFLLAHKDGKGSLLEAGVAIGSRKRVIAVGPRMDITPMLDDSRYVTWFSETWPAVEWISELA